MINVIEKYLKETVLIPGLSGHEQSIAAYMSAEFTKNELSVETDVFGNCIAKLEGTDLEAPVIMVFAHMDSLGFMVRYIEDDGFIRIERLGGIPEKVLPSTQIQIQCRDGSMVDGVIGVKAHHVTPPEEKYVVEKYTNLFVDIGATSRQQVLDLGIDIGSPIIYKPKFQKLQGTRILASFADNRTGCTALLTLSHFLYGKKSKSTVYLVGTIQEEFNLRGAMMAARTIKPDIAICIDGGACGDTPDLQGSSHVQMGDGPILTMYNFHGRGTLNGTIPHPAMLHIMEESANKAKIKFQRSVMMGGLTDAAYLQLEGMGIKCVDIGCARRYTHSPCEIVDMKDIEILTKWVMEFLQGDYTTYDFERE